MTGADRFALRYCEEVVVGSDFIISRDGFVLSGRRLGVEGAAVWEDEGVEAVGMADSDDWAE